MKEIADAGLIVAFLGHNDPHHHWAAEVFPLHAPFHTCDVILAEAASFFANPERLLKLVASGDLILDRTFVLADEWPRVLALVAKYLDHPMDLADACLVRMSELATHCRIWTVDRADFSVYRRHGRQPIACEFPPE